MRLPRWALAAGLLTLLGAALYLTVPGADFWAPAAAHVKPLGPAEQEVAYLEPATNADDWERLVTAAAYLQRDWPALFPDRPALSVSLDRAFPPLTADIPEIGLWFAGAEDQVLWLRWYKLSGLNEVQGWVEQLRRRPHAPLAVLGGGTSGRAIRLAQTLTAAAAQGWAGSPPAFLMTTATAEEDQRIGGQRLITQYPGRTFRFAFTNARLAEAVLRFVRQNPQVWGHRTAGPAVLAGAAAAAAAPAAGLGLLLASGHFNPYALRATYWRDDNYSRDLADLFVDRFHRLDFHGPSSLDELPYSAGDFYHPTPPEQALVGTWLADPDPFPPHSLVVLPTSPPRMRRLLGNLRSRAPLDVRNVVVVNGDAISFNTVYRDRNYIWNVQDLPFSLIFFAHRNPIDPAAGFGWAADPAKGEQTTGTHDLLLYRDLLEAVLHATFDGPALLADADAVVGRLRHTRWYQSAEADRYSGRVYNALAQPWAAGARPLFDPDGDRQPHTGEHIVWLRPRYSGDLLDLVSTISVWEAAADPADDTWRLVASHAAAYNQTRAEGR